MTAAAPRQPRKIFLIAAEESGDRLGAALMTSLRAQLGGDVQFIGVGGAHMAGEGLASLFPIEQLSIIGFAAIPKRLPMILRRIEEATQAVLREKPDVLVIVDSPDFTHRVAKRVRARDPSIPIVNYVSPTVWVWRQGRARKMRSYVDRVLAVLPFEVDVHHKLGGPPTSYVGHPLIENLGVLQPGAQERARRAASPPILLLLPGSRGSEIARNMSIFGETLRLLRAQGVDFQAVLPTLPHVAGRVRAAAALWHVEPDIVTGEAEKRAAFRNARAALTKSGTVTLELALANVPMVAVYRVSPVEAFVAFRVIRTSSIILPNLILGENVIPEFLQDDFRPEKLLPALREVLSDSPLRQRQLDAFQRLERIMSLDGEKPSDRAARVVIDTFQNRA